MATIALIAAMSETGLIGQGNRLPWRVPAELKYFQAMTRYKPVIMGRKTFESIGKPLPDRHNIVLSREWPNPLPSGVDCVTSVPEALECAKQYLEAKSAGEIMVIGGAQVYQLFMPLAHRLYISTITGDYVGDVFFPPVDWTQWRLDSEEAHEGFVTKIFDKIV